jgi:outer membrane protein TolC
VFNRRQTHELAQAREAARGASHRTEARREEAVLRAIELFLDADHAARGAEAAARQAASAEKIAGIVQARVSEGRELPIEARRAALETAKARHLALQHETLRGTFEAELAAVLGYAAGDRVRPVRAEPAAPPAPLPESEAAAIELALKSSAELRHLESAITAKGLEAKANQASRLPKLDLVGQYGLFARFNNYDDFFRKFQRHNGQFGLALEIPVYAGPGVGARSGQIAAEIERLRTETNQTRARIALHIQQDYLALRRAEGARELARLDLDIAREALGVVLARAEEGRAPIRELEEARQSEAVKWFAYYDALHGLEKSRFALLHRTGRLWDALP